jgi:hypothetical protein
MAKRATKVMGIVERPTSSGRWYVRYRKNRIDVGKSFGHNKTAAMAYIDKARTLNCTGPGFHTTTTMRSVHRAAGMPFIPDNILLGELCDGLLKQIANDPEKYRDQYNPPNRVARIKKAFGKRLASRIRPYEISDWLTSLEGPDGKRLSPGTWNRYKTVFSAIYVYGNERELISVNPVRGFRRRKEADGVIRYLDPKKKPGSELCYRPMWTLACRTSQFCASTVCAASTNLTWLLGLGFAGASNTGSPGTT